MVHDMIHLKERFPQQALTILTAIGVFLYRPLIGWFVFGLAAFINTRIFDKVFHRYYPKEEQNQQK